MTEPVRIANVSGFFGDRLAAAREMVEGGPIDVLTGDWLAELTMLILARQRMKHGPGAGYARTFLTQMEHVLGTCQERGIKVVSNAGGLDPQGCADALGELIERLGLPHVRIAVVSGDDLMPRLGELARLGEDFVNLDTGETLEQANANLLTANAYLGGAPISAALTAGADVVITGRVTDAAVLVGPAAWWHGWSYADDLDALAGAVVAGHAIECGAQVTGGNYAFFQSIRGLEHPGFPIAEVAADGSSVITKHPGTGGAVTVGTVTAQLLYEIGSPAYANPDVTARFDTIHLTQTGPDRVEISGVVGEAPPPRLKVAATYLGGFRNSMTLVITGRDAEAKADLALRTIAGVCLDDIASADLAERSTLPVRDLQVAWTPATVEDPSTIEQAQSLLRLTVRDSDPKAVGKPFTTAVVESALASYPGMFPTAPPGEGTPYGVYWPTTVARENVEVHLTVEGESVGIEAIALPTRAMTEPGVQPYLPALVQGETVRVPLGVLVGARSGDKGGAANVGLWIPRSAPDIAVDWLLGWVTPDRIRQLLPEAAALTIDVHPLPNLRAVNVVIHRLLGRGVSENSRTDPQAKGLGEFLRARIVDIPAVCLPDAGISLA